MARITCFVILTVAATALSLTTCSVRGDESGSNRCNLNQTVPLLRFKDTAHNTWLMTIDPKDPALLRSTFDNQTTVGSVFPPGKAPQGTVPVYRYVNPATFDHFLTTDPANEILGSYTFERAEFYMDVQVRCTGQVPLYRYWNGKAHLFTTDPKDAVVGYQSEGIRGHIFPPK